MTSRYRTAARIWVRRTSGEDSSDPRRDIGFIAYSVFLLAMICLVPIVRLLLLSLITPAASEFLSSESAARIVGASAVGICVAALWAGRFQGPATLPPFLTYALAGSEIPRYVVFRRPLLIAASWVVGLVTSVAVLLAASMWVQAGASFVAAILIIASWFLLGLIAFCLWQVSQVFPRSCGFAALLLIVLGVGMWLNPNLSFALPFGWPSVVFSGDSYSAVAVGGLALIAAICVTVLPRLLERLEHTDLIERSIRLAQARAQVFVMEFGRASSMYREPPRLLRTMGAVRPSSNTCMTICRQDLLAPLRSPVRLVTSLVCVISAGLLMGFATALGPISIVLGLVAGLLSYAGIGALAEGLRLAADQVSDLPLFGISDRSLVGSHLIVPAIGGILFAGAGAVIGTQVGSGSVIDGVTTAAILAVTTVAAVLMSALKGPMPVQLLNSVPSPMGDPMVFTRAVWALDGPVASASVGIAASVVVTAPLLAPIVAVIVGVVLVRRWVHRR